MTGISTTAMGSNLPQYYGQSYLLRTIMIATYPHSS